MMQYEERRGINIENKRNDRHESYTRTQYYYYSYYYYYYNKSSIGLHSESNDSANREISYTLLPDNLPGSKHKRASLPQDKTVTWTNHYRMILCTQSYKKLQMNQQLYLYIGKTSSCSKQNRICKLLVIHYLHREFNTKYNFIFCFLQVTLAFSKARRMLHQNLPVRFSPKSSKRALLKLKTSLNKP